ncbi:MAG: DUF3795 domain-containing protein [Methanomicrobiales archaeon]|nr:DUF3795 domain-containing protein [Methanomicrobiales archaeon]
MADRQTGADDHPRRFIGCCGAYCRTCRPFLDGFCKGCKLGYATGERDIARAKCPIKVCCYGKHHLETCAECPDYAACTILSGFYAKKGHKYKKYREAIEFIREHGYAEFLAVADTWKGAYGTYRNKTA